MAIWIERWERRARFAVAGVAILGVGALLAFEQGWIATAPSYKSDAWYLVGGNQHLVMSSEYADEASCRREEDQAARCRSGKVLLEEAFSQQRQASHL